MKKAIVFLMYVSCTLSSRCQNVGIGTTAPSASAQLEVASTSKGFLPPRMTASQRILIPSPAEGLLVFQTDGTKGYYYFANSTWNSLVDEKVYATVTICNQKWMDKNLDVITYRNGDTIPYVPDPVRWASLTTGAWCYYDNDPATDAVYGKLYNWYAVTDSRGLAPAGWHIPTDPEWATLVTCLGGSSVAGGKMKVSGTRNWADPNSDADNSSGWSGQPGGNRADQGFFRDDKFSGLWWSNTSSSATAAWYRYLLYSNGGVGRDLALKYYGFSVRCIKD